MQVQRFVRTFAALVVAVALSASACSKKAEASETTSKAKCMTELSPEQKAQYVEQNGPPVSETTREDGTQDVCVLEKQPDGSYRERHYNDRDGFGDYLFYSMLFGHSNTLATYGLITGDLDFGQYLALSLLTGVNSRGGLFSPYSCGLASCPYGQPYSWNRQPTVINNVRVTNIQYGNQPARTYNGGKRPKPPTGYAKPKPIPKASDKVAEVKKDQAGKPTVAPIKGVSAKKVAAGKQPLPASVKSASPVTTIAKPKPNTQSTTKPATNTPGTVKPNTNATTKSNTPATAKAPSSSGSKSSGGSTGSKSSGSSGGSSGGRR